MISKTKEMLNYMAQHPEKTVSEIAKDLGYHYQTVYMVKRNYMDKAKPKKSEPKLIMEYVAPEKTDPVNSPAHYLVGGIETIDFIEAKQLNYNLGNAVKYIARSGHKDDRKQDIEKAVWYLKREISRML
jgi:hypothetical protein